MPVRTTILAGSQSDEKEPRKRVWIKRILITVIRTVECQSACSADVGKLLL